jgi:hypothetical protein
MGDLLDSHDNLYSSTLPASAAPQPPQPQANLATIYRTIAPSAATATIQQASTRTQPAPLALPPPVAQEVNQLTDRGRSLITLSGLLGPHAATILVDSGATGNFVSSSFVRSRSGLQPSSDSSLIKLADGREQPAAGLLPAAPITIGHYSDQIDLTVTDLSGYDIILGMSWLHHYNPTIDWRGRRISFTDSAGRRHQLRKASSAASPKQPTQRSTHSFSLNLITAKRLRRACELNQIEYACVVWAKDGQVTQPGPEPGTAASAPLSPNTYRPDEGHASPEFESHPINSARVTARDLVNRYFCQVGPQLLQPGIVAGAVQPAASTHHHNTAPDGFRSQPLEPDRTEPVGAQTSGVRWGNAVVGLSPTQPEASSAIKPAVIAMEPNQAEHLNQARFSHPLITLDERHAKTAHENLADSLSCNFVFQPLSESSSEAEFFSDSQHAVSHSIPPFQYAHTMGESRAESQFQPTSSLAGDSCSGTQLHLSPSHHSSSAAPGAVRPLFYCSTGPSGPSPRAQRQADRALPTGVIQRNAVSRDLEALRAWKGQIWSLLTRRLTQTQRERAGDSPVARPRGVSRGGGEGTSELLTHLHATQLAGWSTLHG